MPGGGSWHIIGYISHHSEAEVTSYIDQLNTCSGGRSSKVECLEEGSGREFDGGKSKVREATG